MTTATEIAAKTEAARVNMTLPPELSVMPDVPMRPPKRSLVNAPHHNHEAFSPCRPCNRRAPAAFVREAVGDTSRDVEEEEGAIVAGFGTALPNR
jgi:hypothetical protein